MSAFRKRKGLAVIAVGAHREAWSRALEEQRAECCHAQHDAPESRLRQEILEHLGLPNAVPPVEPPRPDDVALRSTKRLHRSDDVRQFCPIDEAKHPAHQDDVCGRRRAIGTNVRGVPVYELNVTRKAERLTRFLAIRDQIRIQLDQARTRVREPLVTCQGT